MLQSKNIIRTTCSELKKSKDEGWWVATDVTHQVVVVFKEGDFNESKKIKVSLGGIVFCEKQAAKTFFEVIDHIGGERVRELNIL